MSHIVQIQAEVRDPQAVAAACRRLGLPEPAHGTATLFEGQAAGLLVRLPDWLYPVVCDVQSGALRYDNYGGRWGDPRHLDNFVQRYAVEKATIEARKRGHAVAEQALSDGSIRLTIEVGGVFMKTIEITIGPRGETTVRTAGFTGGECREASRFAEQALSRPIVETLTAEFYQGQSVERRLDLPT